MVDAVSVILAAARDLERTQHLVHSLHENHQNLNVVVCSPSYKVWGATNIHDSFIGSSRAMMEAYDLVAHRGDYVAWLTDECLPIDDCFERMKDFLEKNAASPFIGEFRVGDIDRGCHACGFQYSRWGMMSRKAIYEIGFFDSGFRSFFGDVDLGLRCWENGGSVATCEDSCIKHSACVSVDDGGDDELAKSNIERHFKPDLALFLEKWPGFRFWEMSMEEGTAYMAKRMALRRDEAAIREHRQDSDEDFKIAQTLRTKTGTVSVGLKLPNGLIMKLYHWEEHQEPILGGGFRTFKIAKETPGRRHVLYGNRWAFGTVPKYLVIDGYAITPNIPEADWDEWCKQNHDSTLLLNGLIKAYRSPDKLAGYCREHAETMSGLEPLPVNILDGSIDRKDPRMRAFSRQGNLSGIQTATKD